ncbi:hypothetical protein VTK26DRAFT_4878 [Humicola hyalothermophila]
MRPPRVAILVLFFSASIFLVCRSLSSIRRPRPTVAPETATQKTSFRTLFSFTAPFSLFPPSAAISLTDDNSTFFPARPAAFGPPLPSKGLSGPLWIGSGFSEETLQEGEGEGELGCSDIPGWEDGRTKVTIKPANQGSTTTVPLDITNSKRNIPAEDSLADHDQIEKRWSKTINDGTDDHLHEWLKRTRSAYDNGKATSDSNHADIQSIQESAEITGKIALLSRGGCGFLEKVKWAQRRGAIAVIVGDNQKGGPLIQMFARGNVDNVTIPSVFTSRTTAHLLSSLMQPGSFIEDMVDESGNPMLRVQNSAKAGSRAKQKRASSANHVSKTSPARAPGHRASTPKVTKSSTAPRGLLSRLFNWGGVQSITLDASRPPSSGRLTWAVDDNIGVQDWHDPDLARSSAEKSKASSQDFSKLAKDDSQSGAPGDPAGQTEGTGGHKEGDQEKAGPNNSPGVPTEALTPVIPTLGNNDGGQGLWVTITPTGSASPFFDTLLVLVVSPLITLSVVYALLILRVKIRMRRWRAPKSVVDRLPVRTYHAVAPSPTQTPRAPSPASSSPTTPLLQGTSRSRQQTHTGSGEPEREGTPRGDDSMHTPRTPSREKNTRRTGSEWKKYMSRQVECVVCLEEYVDGVSKVMSLPCGHEFHVECITPWLTTRRRTCPICKSDVVRSLARGSPSTPQYEPFNEDTSDDYGESSESYQNRPLSPDRLEDLERGPSWNQGSSRQGWHGNRDAWFSTLTSRLGGGNPSFSLRREGSTEDRSR